MISDSDLLHLSYTSDLTEGGISYACRSLALSVNRKGSLPFDRLRHVVVGAAVELAFRRYLGEQATPFEVGGHRPFTNPDRYDVLLGGHRCDLKSYPLSRLGQVALLRQNPALVLQAPALVPLDEFAAEGRKPDYLYLFAFYWGWWRLAGRMWRRPSPPINRPISFILCRKPGPGRPTGSRSKSWP